MSIVASIESAVMEYYSDPILSVIEQMSYGLSGVNKVATGQGGGLTVCDFCGRANDFQIRTRCEGCGAPLKLNG